MGSGAEREEADVVQVENFVVGVGPEFEVEVFFGLQEQVDPLVAVGAHKARSFPEFQRLAVAPKFAKLNNQRRIGRAPADFHFDKAAGRPILGRLKATGDKDRLVPVGGVQAKGEEGGCRGAGSRAGARYLGNLSDALPATGNPPDRQWLAQ